MYNFITCDYAGQGVLFYKQLLTMLGAEYLDSRLTYPGLTIADVEHIISNPLYNMVGSCLIRNHTYVRGSSIQSIYNQR